MHMRSLCSISSHAYQQCGSYVVSSWAQGPTSISKHALLAHLTTLWHKLLRSRVLTTDCNGEGTPVWQQHSINVTPSENR